MFKGQELVPTFHPYHVRHIGSYLGAKKIANKALDRIQHISLANVPFRPNTDIDFTRILIILLAFLSSRMVLK